MPDPSSLAVPIYGHATDPSFAPDGPLVGTVHAPPGSELRTVEQFSRWQILRVPVVFPSGQASVLSLSPRDALLTALRGEWGLRWEPAEQEVES